MKRAEARSVRAGLAALALTACTGLTAAAQARPGEAGPDPYTGGDAAAIAKAGYVQVGGKMPWGLHDTAAIENILGDLPYIWIETAHFRIGCTLPPFTLTKAHRKKLRAELKQLKQALPNVKPKTRVLDPWLRAHLFAQRCESIYAEFSEMIGVEDGDFPESARQRASRRFMGVGPYLGQGDKFLLLVLDQAGSFERYANKFIGATGEYPRRHAFGLKSSVLFGTAVGCHESLADDTAMHCQVVRNLVANFIDGFKSYCQEAPAWWKYGVGMCFARQIDPEFTDYDRVEAVDPDIRGDGNWRPRIYKLVKNGGATSLDTLIRRPHCGEFKFRDYLVSWSLAEYLMQRSEDGFAEFIHELKTPIYDGTSGKIPTTAEMHERQVEAIQNTWGLGLDRLQREWGAWVLKRKLKR